MNDAAAKAEALVNEGVMGLRDGKFEHARDALQQAIAMGASDASTHLALAFAYGNLGEDQNTLDAIDAALAVEPRNLRALLYRADHQSRHGRTRKALVFYDAALRIASEAQEQLPNDVQQGLMRAQSKLAEFTDDYEDYLLDGLKARGYSPHSAHPRFNRALDIALGKRQVYYQQPTRFHYPELPQVQFFPKGIFPWMEQLEAAFTDVREEMMAVLNQPANFSPYLVSDADVVQFNDASNVDNEDWGAYFFYEKGLLNEAHAASCPKTVALLNDMPLPKVPGSTPHALYSRLAGQTRIPPHHGLINTRLICHLPLLVPENCGGLRCGNQVELWQEGRAYVFDDSIEHEAWNDSEQDRVVLLFDIWRPELTEEEKELIGAMLQTVSSYEEEAD